MEATMPPDGLSARQRQILELLRAGKVNKEIANDLGIGLGTVKQHVVALFKKLNVRNRTMAVSVTTVNSDKHGEAHVDDGLLEKRPCVVVSFALTPDVLAESARLLHRVLAEHAYDQNTIYLSRHEAGGDLILGIQQTHEQEHFQSLRVVTGIVRDLDAAGMDTRNELKSGMNVGLAIASMRRFGGWSGEALVSAIIAQARALAEKVAPGHLSLGDEACLLFDALGPTAHQHLVPTLPFDDLDHVPWRFDLKAANEAALVGREAELAELTQSIKRAARGGSGVRIHIEAETGMGKSSLCRAAISLVMKLGGEWRYLFCQAVEGSCAVHESAEGRPVPLADLPSVLGIPGSARSPTLCVIDDAHFLPADIRSDLLHRPLADGQVLLLTGRRQPGEESIFNKTFHLGRLPFSTCQVIVGAQGHEFEARQIKDIAEQAAGVPLFAAELAKSGGKLPLSLRFVVAGRMDRLGLDRQLLRCVARSPGSWSAAQLVASMHEAREKTVAAAEQALAAGVLKRDEQDRYHYSHPLLRQAVLQSEVDKL
jgi:DNA-binding CsgD family transcriptional regulator